MFGKVDIAAIKPVFWKKVNWKIGNVDSILDLAIEFMSNLKSLSLVLSCKIDVICKMTNDFWMKNVMYKYYFLKIPYTFGNGIQLGTGFPPDSF